MGKQDRRAAPAGSEEERIRALTRELHEHTREARDVTRELRAAQADADLARARLQKDIAAARDEAATRIRGRLQEIEDATDKAVARWSVQFRTEIARQADLPSGDALVERVTVGLGALIRPLVDKAIGEAIEHRLGQLLTEPVPDDDSGRRRRRSGLSFPNAPRPCFTWNPGGTRVPGVLAGPEHPSPPGCYFPAPAGAVWIAAVGAPVTLTVWVAGFHSAAALTVMTSPSQYCRTGWPPLFRQMT